MKAMQAMLYLFIFNLVIMIITGLGIFDITMSTGAQNFLTYNTLLSGKADTVTMFMAFTELWGALVMGGVGGAVAAVLNVKLKTSSAAAYIAFGTLLSIVFVKSSALFFTLASNISEPHAKNAVLVIVVAFMLIQGLMFGLGFIQMVRGGFKSSM